MKKGVLLFLFILGILLTIPGILAASSGSVISNFDTGGTCIKGEDWSSWKGYYDELTDLEIMVSGYNVRSCRFDASGNAGLGADVNYTPGSYCCPDGYSCIEDLAYPGEPKYSTCQPTTFCHVQQTPEDCDGTSALIQFNANRLEVDKIESFAELTTCDSGSFCCTNKKVICEWEDGKCNFVTISYIDEDSWNSIECTPQEFACIQKYSGIIKDTCDAPNFEDRELIVSFNVSAENRTNSPFIPHQYPFDSAVTNLLPDCKPVNITYECNSSIQLPFFTSFNFLLSILGVVFLYVIFRKNLMEEF